MRTTIKGRAWWLRRFARTLGTQGGDYAELLGRESDTNAQVRTRGFHAVLDTMPGLKRVAAQSANWSQSEAFQKTETILQAHGEYSRHHCRQRHHGAGRGCGGEIGGAEGIVVTGFDGSPDALAAIGWRRSLRATALQPAVRDCAASGG